MTSSTRTGRRRRMLHEGASAPTAVVSDEDSNGVKVRYTPPEGSSSFAVASRALPRSSMALSIVVAGLLAVTGLVGWASGVGSSAVESDSAVALLLNVDRAGSLAAWWEACLWLAVAGQCVLLFGMRRHRTNDLGGSYRWWLFAAAVATGMSVCSATHANTVVASQLASLTGFSPIGGNLFWKVIPGGLLATGAAAWAVLEVRECSASVTYAGAAGLAAAVSAATSAGFVPALGASLPTTVIGSVAATTAAVMVLGMLLAYSRRIVRETHGEVAPPAVKKPAQPQTAPALEIDEETEDRSAAPSANSKKRSLAAYESEEDEEPAPAKGSAMRKPRRESSRPKLAEETASSKWVGGGEDYSEDYEDEAPQLRKRTKAERKALRREKQRRAA